MASQNKRQFTELLEEIADHHGSARAFARSADVDKSILNRLLNGRARRVDPQLVSKIAAASDNRIGMDQFAAFFARLAFLDSAATKRRAA